MSYKYNDPLHHVIGNALNDGCKNWGVVSGLAVSERAAGANMSVDVASGNCFVDGTEYTESGVVNVVIANAHGSLQRKDLIIYDTSAGNPAAVTGTPAATAIPPDIPAGDILLAVVDVPASDTTITNNQIHDGRVFVAATLMDTQMPGLLQKYVISDDVLHSHDGLAGSSDTSYYKYRTIAINTLHPTPATLRIRFGLYASLTSGNVYGKIYKNGVAFGTERTTSSTSCVYFSEDLSFAEGDTIELWGYKTNPAAAVLVEDFRVLGDDDNLTLAEAINGSDAGVADAWDATNS